MAEIINKASIKKDIKKRIAENKARRKGRRSILAYLIKEQEKAMKYNL